MKKSISSSTKQYIESVAQEALKKFHAIATAASERLAKSQAISTDPLANPSAFGADEARRRIQSSLTSVGESHQLLQREPAIARVLVMDSSGQKRTYYICRTSPVSGVPGLASYRAPLGRLAALKLGDSIQTPNGEELEVLEQAQFRPMHDLDGWDSIRTLLRSDSVSSITIDSLRIFLASTLTPEQVPNVLEKLLAAEKQSETYTEGVRRSVITKMGLRDQPVLDRFQDEIFRLPLDSRLVLLGPPGTGKTTTLIRRLGQKLDIEFLTEEERELLGNVGSASSARHASSWLMFTPTSLLRLYLKEAFAREGVPAPDERIRTWDDFRRDVSRHTFPILKTASGGGTFILRETLESLTVAAKERPIQWFEEFYKWNRAEYQRELREAADSLQGSSIQGAKELGKRLIALLGSTAWRPIVAESQKAQDLLAGLKGTSDERITDALNRQLRANNEFLSDLSRFLDSVEKVEDLDVDDGDDLEDSADEEVANSRAPLTRAKNAYMRAVRAQARSVAGKRAIRRTSQTGKVIEWIGDKSLTDEELLAVGNSLWVQSRVRRFIDPVRRFVDGVPKRYRAFRKADVRGRSWYSGDLTDAREIHPLELDVVLLTILRSANDVLSSGNVRGDIDKPEWSALKRVADLWRNQILVDEATDFSPIQLACMAALGNPNTRSFFACGDFNQRLTSWGARSADDIRWVVPGVEFREVSVGYRQSRQLNELAREIIRTVGGADQAVSLPEEVDSDGVQPALIENCGDLVAVVSWLADRILEIERFVGQLPSTAIFVNSESEVVPLAGQLNKALAEHNMRVAACSQGQIVGQDNDVRVFDIQHIKGLEFEAVFFVAVDRLSTLHPDLFDKYLYVGATRAATYLGLTCENTLPSVIGEVRPRFGLNWQAPGLVS